MKTEVVLSRELFGCDISQKSKSEFFSATDLVKAGNKYRAINGLDLFNITSYWSSKQTIEFIDELEKKYGKVKIAGKGRGSHTWVHPLVFIDIALNIHPKLKVEVYEWLFDSLIKFRNDSGDSYKEMAAALYVRHNNHKEFPNYIKNVAFQIQAALKIDDWNKADESTLKKRDSIHTAIKLYSRVLTNPDDIVRLGIYEGLR